MHLIVSIHSILGQIINLNCLINNNVKKWIKTINLSIPKIMQVEKFSTIV